MGPAPTSRKIFEFQFSLTSLISLISLSIFSLLATANGAGYRYGVSDQAFYIPAITHALDPQAFPRDVSLIAPQARLTIVDEALAAVVRGTGLPLPVLFAAGYFASLVLIWVALNQIGGVVYKHRWTAVALLAALTLRHQITRTSANTLEPYFHPRMLAFAVCALGVAAVLKRQPWLAIALVAGAALIHPTTALWFALAVGVALIVSNPTLRPVLFGAAIVMVLLAAWAVTSGPLAGSMRTMDDQWLQALASKTTLFANEWPAAAWLANIGTCAVLGLAYFDRRRRGAATAEDTGLVAGGAALLLLFLATLPLAATGAFLFVELQISRVFWVIDFLATIYLLGVIDRFAFKKAVAVALIVFSVARGVYALRVEHPERALFSWQLEPSDWHDAMRWIASRPVNVHVLADPGHAWKYGTSVRVSAGRDVFQEDVKDSAMAIYSRAVAMRVLERSRALADFEQLNTARARALAQQYDLDYAVTSGVSLDLPVVYRNQRFSIYTFR